VVFRMIKRAHASSAPGLIDANLRCQPLTIRAFDMPISLCARQLRCVRVSAHRTGGVTAHRDRLVDGNQVVQHEKVVVLLSVRGAHFIRTAHVTVVAGDHRHLAGLQRTLGQEALPEANDGADWDARRGQGRNPVDKLVDVLDGQAGTTINRQIYILQVCG
jgi:hypothetical protein